MSRVTERKDYLPAEINGKNNPLLRERYPDNLVHIIGRAFLTAWMLAYHRLDVQLDPETPRQGPVLFLSNHDSHTTTTTLMKADPYYPWTTVPVKSDLFQWRIIGDVLDSWGAIPVNRDGKDGEAAEKMLNLLSQGRTVCIAAEGTRSKDGRLQPMDSALVGLTIMTAKAGIPVVPLVEIGTYKALPAGSFIYRPSKIIVRGGEPLDLSPWTSQRVTWEVRTEVAKYMQSSLASLLPEDQKPGPGTKAIWRKSEYMESKAKPETKEGQEEFEEQEEFLRISTKDWMIDKLRRPTYQKGIRFKDIFTKAA